MLSNTDPVHSLIDFAWFVQYYRGMLHHSYWGEPKRAPHKWCQSSVCIYVYILYICIYLPSVIPYIPVFYFNDMQYFFRYTHAHTTSQWSEHFNVELQKGQALWQRAAKKEERLRKGRNKYQKFQEESGRDSDWEGQGYKENMSF